jgi:ABC-type transporter Mla subunit MlaD
MMATSAHFKLGLLTLLTVFAIGLAAFVLAIRRHPADTYHTYFDESVQGLDKGAMVKFRGVRIGKVTNLGVAPDHRMIDVELAIDHGAINLERFGRKLRAQIVAYGITGVKLIDLDIERPETPPPPTLSFIPPKNYLPSRPSLLDSLSQRLDVISEKLLILVDRAIGTVDNAREFVTNASRTAKDISSLSRRIDATTVKLDKLLASANETADSARSLFKSTSNATQDIDQTLRVMRDTARSIGMFFDALERQPDMLLKGRTRGNR